MKKRILIILCNLLLAVTQLFAQSRTISGTVTAKEDGLPLPGVTVKIKGTTTGTQTGINGKFTLNAPVSATLSFSFIGYANKDVIINNNTNNLNVALELSSHGLNEVIVTALGISREQKSLGYAAQAVKGDDLTITKQSDLNTALAGKIAGVQVLGGSGAKFGTSTIRIRGVNSLSGGNPIYVVNGVITDPNAVNNDDIESLTVLKGPAATALYGQRASEGAVVIQLKKGVDKGVGVSFNQSTTFEKVYQLPNYQNEYGGGTSIKWNTYTYDPASSPTTNAGFNGVKYYDYGVDESWGPKMDGTLYAPWYFWDPTNAGYGKLVPFVPQPNNVRDFYRTGVTYNTNAAFSKAADNYNFRVSYTNIDRTGITPNSDQKRNNVGLNGELKLTKKLTVSANVNFSQINSNNIPQEGYATQTTGSFSQWFHRDIDMSKLKNYQRADGTFTSWNITSPDDLTPHYWDNPYTEVYQNTSKSNSNRIYGNITASYQFTKDLAVSLIAREDLLNRDDNARVGSGTLNLDSYSQSQYTYKENNYVANVAYNHVFGDLSVKAGAYAETRQDRLLYTGGNTNGGLAIPDLYTLGNSSNAPTSLSYNSLQRVNSYYAYTSFGYKNFLYLDFNVRNDNSSTLPTDNNSYWYGGLSGSFVFTELMPKNDIFTFGKLRLSAAKLGSDATPYQIYQTYTLSTTPYGLSPIQTVPNTLPNATLKPSLSTSYEVGTELHFIQDRIKFDFNYYTRTQKDQILPLPINGTSGYSTAVVNAGSIRNNGIEISLGGTPVKSKDFTWNVDFNIAFNRNKILSLYPGTLTLPVAPDGLGGYGISGGNQAAGISSFGFTGSPRFGVNGVVGGSYGQIIGSGFIRDKNGNIVVDASGMPTWSSTVNLGSMLPSYTGGFSNSFNYKGFTLAFSLDFQKGGKFVSVTQQNLNGSGLGAETVGNNAKGNPVRNAVADGGGTLVAGVHADGTPNTTYVETRSLYEQVYSQIWEKYTFDASYVKLREVSIGYSFPKKMLGKLPFQSAYFGITSQNPWMIYSKVKGVDPSQLQTSFYEGGQLPNTRNLGFNLKLTF